MRLLPTILLLVMAGSIGGCGQNPPAGAGPGPKTRSSGIEGTTVVDIGCPIIRGNTPCPERPLAARIEVTARDASTVIAAADTDDNGRFRINVPPGSYTIRGTNVDKAPVPTALPLHITVHPHAYTQVTVHFDSGVR